MTTTSTKKRYTASDFAHDVLLAVIAVCGAVSLVLSLTGGLDQ